MQITTPDALSIGGAFAFLARLLLADYGATQYQYGFDVAIKLVDEHE
jgi:hypothetical protein